MAKGEEPFDLDKAKKIFATYQDVGDQGPDAVAGQFQDRRRDRSLPAIWENKADFDAKLTKFGDDAKAAEAR